MFDDIPEDNEESYPCPAECGGSVLFDADQNTWVCDSCTWSKGKNPAALAQALESSFARPEFKEAFKRFVDTPMPSSKNKRAPKTTITRKY